MLLCYEFCTDSGVTQQHNVKLHRITETLRLHFPTFLYDSSCTDMLAHSLPAVKVDPLAGYRF